MGTTKGGAIIRGLLAVTAAAALAVGQAQQNDDGVRGPAESRNDLFLTEPPLGNGPWEYQTAQERIRVSVVARGLEWPLEYCRAPERRYARHRARRAPAPRT